ncbi:MAG: PIN domain-containing protein [Anaerolineales bacterium]|nr:PIN domain-containing protein [Anaerolineales bacterium]
MATRIRIFLDTSVIFAGIWSAKGGGRMLLRLGEAGAISLVTSRLAIQELEGALRNKAPQSLGALALLLDRSDITVVGEPSATNRSDARSFDDHPANAEILASAMGSDIEYFVTLDRKHFLENEKLPLAVAFKIGTPAECLEWIRRRLRRMAGGRT